MYGNFYENSQAAPVDERVENEFIQAFKHWPNVLIQFHGWR